MPRVNLDGRTSVERKLRMLWAHGTRRGYGEGSHVARSLMRLGFVAVGGRRGVPGRVAGTRVSSRRGLLGMEGMRGNFARLPAA